MYVESLFQHAVLLAVILSAIPLAVSVVVGFVLSVLQAATQIQEQTLTFVPKVVAVGVVLTLAGHWMVQQLVEFCSRVLLALPHAAQL